LLLASGRFPPKIAELLGVGRVLESRTDGALEEESARPRRRRRRVPPSLSYGSLAAVLGALLLLGGCTAVPALVQCRRAEGALRALEREPARSPAVSYDLTLARVYLDKARELSSQARYGLAIELAKSSQAAAERARSAQAQAVRGRI
jgi:hypothetical protein